MVVSKGMSNQEYAERLKHHFSKSYKMAFEKAVQWVFLSSVKNTWHDSSRAASNWQILLPNEAPTPYEDTRGVMPVGDRGELRSALGLASRMELVAIGKLTDYNRKVTSAIWVQGATGFNLYNAVDAYIGDADEGELYFERAGIENVKGNAKVKASFKNAASKAFEEWEKLRLGDRI